MCKACPGLAVLVSDALVLTLVCWNSWPKPKRGIQFLLCSCSYYVGFSRVSAHQGFCQAWYRSGDGYDVAGRRHPAILVRSVACNLKGSLRGLFFVMFSLQRLRCSEVFLLWVLCLRFCGKSFQNLRNWARCDKQCPGQVQLNNWTRSRQRVKCHPCCMLCSLVLHPRGQLRWQDAYRRHVSSGSLGVQGILCLVLYVGWDNIRLVYAWLLNPMLTLDSIDLDSDCWGLLEHWWPQIPCACDSKGQP